MTRPLVLIALLLVSGTARLAAPPAVARDAHGDALPAGAVARLGTERYRLSGSHTCGLAFTDEGHLVSATDGAVEVLDAKTGRRVRSIRLDFYVRDFALSRDGKRAAVVGDRRRPGQDSEHFLRVLDIADGKEVRTWARGKESFGDAPPAFSPDGKLLASLSDRGVLRLEEVRGGEELLSHRFGGRPRGLAFSPDGSSLAVATDGRLFHWDWKGGTEPALLDAPRGMLSPCFSPDGKTLATADEYEGGILRWDLATGKRAKSFTVGRASASTVCYSPDGKYVLAAITTAAGAALVLMDAVSGEQVRTFPGRHGYRKPVAFSPDSRRIASLEDGRVRVWEGATGKELSATADSHTRFALLIEMLKGDVAVTASEDGTVRFWDARTGRQTKRIDATSGWVRGAAVSPDGRWLAASAQGKDGFVGLWDLKTDKLVYRLPGHGGMGGRSLRFSPDGKRLASFGHDQYLRLWDVARGKAVEEYGITTDGKGGPLSEAGVLERGRHSFLTFESDVFSADASLFVKSYAGSAYVFDVASGRQTAKLTFDDGRIGDLAISPDNKSLLVVTWGKSRPEAAREIPAVHLCELATGKVRTRLEFPGEAFHVAAFRPDGKGFAIAAGLPRNVRFYDADGKPRGEFQFLARPVALAYSPDGGRILVSLNDTTCLVYPTPR